MQLDLQALDHLKKEWLMSTNASKCSVISISLKSRKAKESNYKLHGQTLAAMEARTYLGMTLNNNLSWNKYVENVTAKETGLYASASPTSGKAPSKSKQPGTLPSFIRYWSMPLQW